MSENQKNYSSFRTFLIAILYAVAIVSLVTTLYGAMVFKTTPAWAKTLIVCGAIGLAFSFLSLLQPQPRRENIGLATLSILLTIFLFNLFIQIPGVSFRPINPLYDSIEKAKEQGLPFDTRSASQVLLDMRMRKVPVHPLHLPAELARDDKFDGSPVFPLGGRSHTDTVVCNEAGKWVIYKTDRFGFNNPDSVYEKQARYRLLMVGDSFTQGHCVEQTHTIASVLSTDHDVAAISIGQSANAPLLELASLLEYGPHFKPDVVLWVWYDGNDLADLPLERNPFLRRYLTAQRGFQNLPARQREIDAFWARREPAIIAPEALSLDKYLNTEPGEIRDTLFATVKGIFTLQGIRKMLGLTKERFLGELDVTQEAQYKEVQNILQTAARATKAWNGRFVFVYLPSVGEKAALHETSRRKLREITAALDIQFIDLGFMQEMPDRKHLYPLGREMHFNAKGYRFIAESIYKDLFSGNLGVQQLAASTRHTGKEVNSDYYVLRKQ